MKRLALVVALGGCVAEGHASLETRTPIVYQEPPQEQIDTPATPNPGHVWARGRWDWREGQWVWIGGHWEAAREREVWEHGRWEKQGHAWHWIDGRWVATAAPTAPVEAPPASSGAMYPTSAPPPPRSEAPGAAPAASIWIGGRWDWKNGTWAWVDGHWERQRASETWVPGRWELQGNYYVWVEGRWDKR